MNSTDEKVSRHDPLEGVSAKGQIVTGAHRSRIPVQFKPVLKRAIEELRVCGPNCSIYVYGSVATGTASVGHSDVDLIAIGLDAARARKIEKILSAEFDSLCRYVAIGLGQPENYLGSDDECYGNCVFLRHYCVHLAGPDIRSELPEFLADEAAARGFNGDIGVLLDKWSTELTQGVDSSTLGRSIARKTLYAVSSLVSIYDHTWTTDRHASAQRWGEVVPAISSELKNLLIWSDAGTTKCSVVEVKNVLDGVVTKVVNDFREQIGLWNY